MKRRYKASAEEAVWECQIAAQNALGQRLGGSGGKAWPPEEARKRRRLLGRSTDGDLRAQMRVAVTKSVRGAYAGS
jgi:hypothetical protein